MGVDILGLHGTEVLKPFKQICFVFAPHQIDLFNRQGIGKFPVIREAPALPLGPQSIDAFVYIVIGSIVVAQDLLIQRQEHLVQRIGGNFTDVPPEEVVLRDLENIPHRFYGEFTVLVQPQHLHQEGAGHCDLQAGHAVQAVIQPFLPQPAFTSQKFFKEPCILQKVLQQCFNR